MGQFLTHQQLALALRESIHRDLQELILRDRIPERDRVYFSLSSNRLNNSYDYRGLPAGEWLHSMERVDNMLQQMSRTLNSNKNFELNDSFQLSFTHVRSAPRGSGHKRKLKPGHAHPQTHKHLKRSIIIIKDSDNLCCARAIVTAKAKVDNHPNWRGFRDGKKIQKEQALLLHYEAGVPFWWMPAGGTPYIPLDHPKRNSWFCYTIRDTMMLSPHYRGSSLPALQHRGTARLPKQSRPLSHVPSKQLSRLHGSQVSRTSSIPPLQVL